MVVSDVHGLADFSIHTGMVVMLSLVLCGCQTISLFHKPLGTYIYPIIVFKLTPCTFRIVFILTVSSPNLCNIRKRLFICSCGACML